MKQAIVTLKSMSPYSQSRPILVEKKDKEIPKNYEERTWRERMHVTESGQVFIPPMAFKNSLAEAAKYLSMQIPGKGKATYTKHFEAGVLVLEPLLIDSYKDSVKGEWLFVPSDGKRGGGTRVWKCFPVIQKWEGVVAYQILDETITEDVFKTMIEGSGQFIGIGRFRPRNNGFYGRFSVEDVQWK